MSASNRFVVLSDAESRCLDVAWREGHERAYRLYYVLRRHMDVETGISGRKRRFSYKGLCEELEVMPVRGSRRAAEAVSRDAVKRELAWLQKPRDYLGDGFAFALIEKVGDLVFELRLAYEGLLAFGEERRVDRRVFGGESVGVAEGSAINPQAVSPDVRPTSLSSSSSVFIDSMRGCDFSFLDLLGLYHAKLGDWNWAPVRLPTSKLVNQVEGVVQAVAELRAMSRGDCEISDMSSLQGWGQLFDAVRQSLFLMGQAEQDFVGSFYRLLDLEFMAGAFNGKYSQSGELV